MSPRGVGGHGLANIMKHLGGIRFPVTKAAMIEHARSKQVDPTSLDTQEVLEALAKIPDRDYLSAVDVLKAMKQKE